MRHHMQRSRTILQRCRIASTNLALEVVPAAVISGATAGITSWLLTFLTHHL